MKFSKYLTCFCFLIVLSVGLHAQTHTWTGNGDGIYWWDPLNWDQGTLPLIDGVGTVIIPTGHAVLSDNVVNFEYGEITGGGTLINGGTFNIINASEAQTSKIISNIAFTNNGNFNIYQATGITNSDPLILNDGTHFLASNAGNISINNIGITTTTILNPGYLDAVGPITKIGAEDIVIDVKLRLCCYDLNIEEGSLTIESKYENLIQSPNLNISQGAGLILSGNNTFNSGARIEGMNEGYLEIKNNSFGNPIIPSTYFFSVEGLLTINSATFSGGGTFRIQEAAVIFTGIGDVTLDNTRIWVQSVTGSLTLGTGSSFSVNLINGGKIANGGDIFLNGANIIGTGSVDDRVSIGGVLSVINNSVSHEFNGINFRVNETLNLNDGTILMDDNSFFENVFYQDPSYPDFIHFGEILGSGLFKFPAYNPSTVSNSGVIIPSPGISTLTTINYSQTNTAKIFIAINSLTDYDIISNSGTTHFEGGFDLTLGYEPQIGDEFVVVQSTSNINNCDPVDTTSATFGGYEYLFDVICNPDNITLKVVSATLSVPEFSNVTFELYTNPNPVQDRAQLIFTADLNFSSEPKLLIYNYMGQLVKTITNLSEKDYTFDRGALSRGLYLLQLEADGRIVASSKMLVN